MPLNFVKAVLSTACVILGSLELYAFAPRICRNVTKNEQ
jgi:hypothetical protein